MKKPELHISIDIETDGPCVGLNSMLAIGAVAYFDYEEVDSFYAKLLPMEDAQQNSETMVWWATQPEAWEEVNKDQEEAIDAMNRFGMWLLDRKREFNASLSAVAWPAAFDFGFINWY